MRWAQFLLAAVLLLAGCAPYAATLGQNAATGALSSLTTPSAQAAIQNASAGAVGAARDELLGRETEAKAQAITAAVGGTLRSQLVAARDAVLDEALLAEVAKLRGDVLGPETQRLLRAIIEDSLGPALRKVVDDLIDEAAPHLVAAVQASIAPIKSSADAEADKYRTVAIACGVSALVALLSLGTALHMLRTHRKLLESLVSGGHVNRSR